MYIDRASKKNGFKLTSKNIYKVFAISSLLAIKMFDDQYFQNKIYADRAGFSLPHFN